MSRYFLSYSHKYIKNGSRGSSSHPIEIINFSPFKIILKNNGLISQLINVATYATDSQIMSFIPRKIFSNIFHPPLIQTESNPRC
uniref:Uncharacterized protein n=1 Tax=Octopus bimaculoides TaxID=37653 RepID=A0A0L8I5A0_OCTBM